MSSKKMSFTKPQSWCLPLVIYTALAAMSLIGIAFNAKKENKVKSFLMTLVSTLFWMYIMFELCRNSHEGWAWFLLLLPVILFAFFVAAVLIFGKGEPGPVNPPVNQEQMMMY